MSGHLNRVRVLHEHVQTPKTVDERLTYRAEAVNLHVPAASLETVFRVKGRSSLLYIAIYTGLRIPEAGRE